MACWLCLPLLCSAQLCSSKVITLHRTSLAGGLLNTSEGAHIYEMYLGPAQRGLRFFWHAAYAQRQAGNKWCAAGGGRILTRSAHSSLYWLSAMRHCSPNMVTYSHHFQGTLLAFASWNTHSCRRFSCGMQCKAPLHQPWGCLPLTRLRVAEATCFARILSVASLAAGCRL